MKKIISMLLAVAMVLTFAACGTKNESSTPQSSAAPVSSTPEKLDTACNVFALNGPTGMGLAPLMKKAEDKIEIFRTLKLKKQLITPTEYPAYYRLMAEWMDTNGNSLLFQTAK